jgi:TetR/AcrR family fatty acid metabolism transcriptional regulator
MPKISSQKTEQTRIKILSSAIEVLSSKEYHKCPIDEIAKRADIGKGTVYLYFKSKEELYYSILFKLIDEMKEIVEAVRLGDGEPSNKITELLVQMRSFLKTHAHIFMIAKAETGLDKGRMHRKLGKIHDALLISISRIIEEGIGKGVFKKYPPVLIGAMFFSMLHTVAHYKTKKRPGHESITPELLSDIFLKGIQI